MAGLSLANVETVFELELSWNNSFSQEVTEETELGAKGTNQFFKSR